MSESPNPQPHSLDEKRVNDLVRRSKAVLLSFRDGRSPTFEMLDRLEMALFPFLEENVCGHKIADSCDCAELNRPVLRVPHA